MEEQEAKEIIVSEDVKKMLAENDFDLRLMSLKNEIRAIILYDEKKPISDTNASGLLCVNRQYYGFFKKGLVPEIEMDGFVTGCISKFVDEDYPSFLKVLTKDSAAVIASGEQTLKLKKKLGN